jgi:nucleoside-diphosphate-sugar epimerase
MLNDEQRTFAKSAKAPVVVLVTGASGFIGQALCRLLMEREGVSVVAAVRRPATGLPTGLSQVAVGEIGPATSWQAALKGVSHVIHLAGAAHAGNETDMHSVNVEGTAALARACQEQSVQRLVLVSSIGVCGPGSDGVPVSEQQPPAPANAYTRSKLDAERVLVDTFRGSATAWTIVRPPLVYGPSAPGKFGSLARLVASGLPLPFARLRHRRSMIYRHNLAHFLACSLLHPEAERQIFHVCDSETPPLADFIRQMEYALGRSKSRLFPCPPALLSVLGRVMGKSAAMDQLLSPLLVDDGKARRLLGWIAPWDTRTALQISLGSSKVNDA